MTIVLRPDQQGPVDEARRLIAQGLKRVLIQGPTGWGKGSVAARILSDAALRGNPSAFVCHREEINADLIQRLKAAGAPSIRVIMGSSSEGDPGGLVTVLSVQTMDARDLSLPHIKLWGWDEAHRSAATSYLESGSRHLDAIHVGFTATPARADGRPLSFFQAVVQGPQIREVVAAGHLAPLRILAPDTAVDALADDPVAIYPADIQGVVFAASREHSRLIAEGLLGRGIKALHVEGSTRNRPAIIDAFNAGQIQVLCNQRILSEGVDTRAAKAIVLASKMPSAVTNLQSIGRGRRPTGQVCTVYDLMGNMWLHGHPDCDRFYHVDGDHGITIAPGTPTQPVQCKGCLGWALPAPRCPQCGFRLPPPKPPKMTKRELRERRLGAVKKEGPGWDLWTSLVQTSRSNGWKPQAAAMQFRSRTGDWPKWTVDMVPSNDSNSEGGDNAA